MDTAVTIFIVDGDNADAMSAIKKITEQSRPGAIIPLTAEEYKAFTKYVRTVSI